MNHRARAFISYSHRDRIYGAQVKTALASVDMDAFLAHEDLETSDVWRKRILEELQSCDVFIPLLSANFVASNWAQQEVGFIISRPETIITPLSIDGTIPFGFISHLQSSPIKSEAFTRELLIDKLAPKFPRQIIPALVRKAGAAADFRSAEKRMQPLVPLFPMFAPWEAQALADLAVDNGQIWDAALCKRKFLPEFIRVQGKFIDDATLRALTYQIERGEWYREFAQST